MSAKEQRSWDQIWNEELSLLDECEVAQAYLLLIVLATGNHDLERLHNLLPRNCQLLQKDFAVLRKIRSATYQGLLPEFDSFRRPSDDVCQAILVKALRNKNLVKYYHEQFRTHSPGFYLDSSKLCPQDARTDISRYFFETRVSGVKATVRIYLSDIAEKGIGIEIIIENNVLTKDLIHKIEKLQPDSEVFYALGRDKIVIWLTSTQYPGLLSLKDFVEDSTKDAFGFIAIQRKVLLFLETLNEILRKAGLLDKNIGPITLIPRRQH